MLVVIKQRLSYCISFTSEWLVLGGLKMIKKIVALFMRFFVKWYFKLDKESYCYCIGTKGDNDDFDIHRREYKNE